MSVDDPQITGPQLIDPHALSAERVLESLNTSETGLNEQEIASRRRHFGPNSLPLKPARPAWRRFLSQFQNVLLYLLIGSGVISMLLQHFVDAGVIFVVVIVNGIVGYIQEGKAEAALLSIMSLARTHCTAIRQDAEQQLDSEELVPGDIVVLQAGDKIPADMRLIYVRGLQCDESALTGESQAVEKNTPALPSQCILAERLNMAYMGTLVTAGTARGVVTRTGSLTEIGAINELVQAVELPHTPMQQQLAQFARQLTVAIVLLAAGVMFFGIFFRDYEFADMFQAAIGIAVASVPEAIPAVVTVILAMGVMRMARRHALIRRLPAVEVLGSVDVICSDKTGTLTANLMSVRELVTASLTLLVSGEGYLPVGNITNKKTGDTLSPQASPDINRQLEQSALIAALCNDASIKQEGDKWEMRGDPTEGALLAFAMKSTLGSDLMEQNRKRIDLLPFEAEYGYMATSHLSPDNKAWLAVKGAPERLLDYCDSQLGPNGKQPIERDYWESQLHALAARGMRVIALARKDIPESAAEKLDHVCIESGLQLVALAGISDPPRPEAIEAIRRCHQAGIRVKMITGDNPITATAIGRELGLNTSTVLSGHELENLNTGELARVVDEVDIFARTSPANKLQLVDALQKQQRVVAMTGDGVNDAPALRKADIGIAMGKRGTDAAREAADFILTKDNFANIAEAVEEGRTVYDNILKSMVFVLPTSIAEAAVITVAILMGLTLPITPAQILWVNMITAVTLALALVFEEGESNIMHRPPRPRGQKFFSGVMLRRLLVVGSGGAIMVFVLFRYYLGQGASIEYARCVAITALVLFEAFYLLNCRFLYQSIFHPRLFRGARPVLLAIASVIVLQLGFCYLPFMQSLFEVAPIALVDWLIIAVSASSIIFVVEIEKLLLTREPPIAA